MNLNLEIHQSAIDAMVTTVNATGKQIDQARSSALRKLKKTIETRVIRYAAQQLRIPQKSLGDRFFSNSLQPGDETLKVWIGTWDVSPFSIGAPRVYGIPGKSGGIKVGRHRTYPGAFQAKIYTNQNQVWIRLRSKHYSPELYPTKYRPGDRGLSDVKGRFPVVRASVPIDDLIKSVLEKHENEFASEFEKIFGRELNYFVNIKGQA